MTRGGTRGELGLVEGGFLDQIFFLGLHSGEIVKVRTDSVLFSVASVKVIEVGPTNRPVHVDK